MPTIFVGFLRYYIHTYIQTLLVITTLQSGLRPSFSQATHIACVNFMRKWGDLQFMYVSRKRSLGHIRGKIKKAEYTFGSLKFY